MGYQANTVSVGQNTRIMGSGESKENILGSEIEKITFPGWNFPRKADQAR
jgi:hypothetical protein